MSGYLDPLPCSQRVGLNLQPEDRCFASLAFWKKHFVVAKTYLHGPAVCLVCFIACLAPRSAPSMASKDERSMWCYFRAFGLRLPPVADTAAEMEVA